jgi:acyl carrier protein
MALISAIETEFDIMLETDDLIDMSSFLKAMEILKKYGITF